jgi:N-acetylmuramoyl-L-alanine amidase
MRNIKRIIIHCSATKEGRDIKTETIRSWHMKGRGWSDIGYHFVIELDGTIMEGRPMERIGAHTRGYNRDSIGICYVGGLGSDKRAKDTRTAQQKRSMDDLIDSLLDRFRGATVHGHNEFSAKACPSFDVSKEYTNEISSDHELD